MKRDQFTFYRSYYEALKNLPQKEQTKVLMAICSYALDETLPSLSGVSLSVFTLIRPTLDAGRNKAANRKNKTKTKQEQNRKEKEREGEKEGEYEGEREEEDDSPLNPHVVVGIKTSEAVRDFLDRVNPSTPVPMLQELAEYEKTLGTAVCKRAFDIALGEKKTTWSYVRGILRNCQARGVRCLADWEALERGRESSGRRAQAQSGNIFAEMLREEGGLHGQERGSGCAFGAESGLPTLLPGDDDSRR